MIKDHFDQLFAIEFNDSNNRKDKKKLFFFYSLSFLHKRAIF